jgi:hypothetical protein
LIGDWEEEGREGGTGMDGGKIGDRREGRGGDGTGGELITLLLPVTIPE